MSKREFKTDDLVDDDLILALKVRETLKDEERWCQHIRHNAHGEHCVIGHVELAMGITVEAPYHAPTEAKINSFFEHLGYYDGIGPNVSLQAAGRHNNYHTHAEVLAKFDKGIEHLRQRSCE